MDQTLIPLYGLKLKKATVYLQNKDYECSKYVVKIWIHHQKLPDQPEIINNNRPLNNISSDWKKLGKCSRNHLIVASNISFLDEKMVYK